jgi:diaminopimelate epimerase
VSTDAGERVVTVLDGSATDCLAVEVDMGEVADLPEPSGWSALECHPDRPVRHLSLGNPHSVVGVDDVNVVDLARLGALVPHVNLEIVAPGPEPDAVTMRVHERGAGLTQACGTGACAVAEAAIAWGLVPVSTREVVVHMPGGDARVRLDRRRATLIGPATYVGDFVVDLAVDA